MIQQKPISFTLPAGRRPEAPIRPPCRLPRITRLMALAIRFEQMLQQKSVKNYADLATLGLVSRARITQIMHLRNLAPDIQETLLFLPPIESWRNTISEHAFRPILQELCWRRQRELFARTFPEHCRKQSSMRDSPATLQNP
jgi:hypothetical protein